MFQNYLPNFPKKHITLILTKHAFPDINIQLHICSTLYSFLISQVSLRSRPGGNSMENKRFYDLLGRKVIVTGHYGSGKTEFSVSLAMLIAAEKAKKLAIIDLDIVNPYFRSRERRSMLDSAGIPVYGSHYKHEITAEFPALNANIRTPLEDKDCFTIIDAGGNDSGALVLNQFTKYFTDEETTVLAVINANRPDTQDLEGTLRHINAIETTTGLKITKLVNNTHLLRETTPATIIKGYDLCKQIQEETGKELLCNCYPAAIIQPEELPNLSGTLMPMGLHMRPKWLDG